MSRKRFFVLVLLQGLFTAFIALLLLSFFAHWLFAPITDPASETTFATVTLWVSIYLISIGLGIVEGSWNWKKYKNSYDDTLLK